jgi:chemotaxis protein methyltransferase CheR
MNPLLNEEIEISIAGVRQLIELSTKRYNHDLSCYALTSFKRRLVKFIEVNDLRNLDVFLKRIDKDEKLFISFLTALSVEVTELFRDPALWRYFRDDVLPALSRNHDHIKIWIPGCSTGEEVASTAIVLKEAGMLDKTEIIATDITDEIVNSLKSRIYPISKHELSEANYKRYMPETDGDFEKYIIFEKNGFRLPENLFKNVVCQKYDYKEDLKIRGINVIICRNNFIYYTAQFQERLLELFSSKLAFNGYLLIGNKENISWCKDIAKYSPVNENEKVYRKTSPY